VKGTVTAFDWANPHVMIFVDGTDGKGGTQKWSVETRGGPKVLAKAGWSKDSIKVGDYVGWVSQQERLAQYEASKSQFHKWDGTLS
jgi:hypothetical protein